MKNHFAYQANIFVVFAATLLIGCTTIGTFATVVENQFQRAENRIEAARSHTLATEKTMVRASRLAS